MERTTAIVEEDTFVCDARDTVRALAIAAAVLLMLLVATGAAALAGYGTAAFLVVAATGALFGLRLALEGVTRLLRTAWTDVPTLRAGRVSWDPAGLVIEHPVVLRSPLVLPWSTIEVLAVEERTWPGGGAFAVRTAETTRPLDQPDHLVERPEVDGKSYPVFRSLTLSDAWPNLLVVLHAPVEVVLTARAIDRRSPRLVRGDLKLSSHVTSMRTMVLRVADVRELAAAANVAGVSDRIDGDRWRAWCERRPMTPSTG